MDNKDDTLLQNNLDPGEKIIWQGPSRKKASHKFILAGAMCLTIALLWLGWSSSSGILRIVLWLIAIAPGSFAALMVLDLLNSNTICLTTKRVFNVNKLGGVLPREGFPYDFEKECTVIPRGKTCDLDIPTLVLDHGFPEYVSLGALDPDVVEALIDAFKGLKSGQDGSRTSP